MSIIDTELKKELAEQVRQEFVPASKRLSDGLGILAKCRDLIDAQ